jgi:hypothetical protein
MQQQTTKFMHEFCMHHVSMQPLIKDMMKLWSCVDTYDACVGKEFKLHAAFFGRFMTILDMPLFLAAVLKGFTHMCIVMRIHAMSL